MSSERKASSCTRLGFIGLGYLGSRTARRLIDAGFPMVVYNRDRAKTKELAALGAEVAETPGKLAAGVDVVLSCLTDGPAVDAVYLSPGGVLDSARPGTRIIELSTIAPENSRRLYLAARKLRVSVLDVAVSVSTGDEAGNLTLFGGGDQNIFESAAPIFAAFARQWFYMGTSGSGVAMKLVVNSLLGMGMQAIAEATALGSRLGLPRDLLFGTLAKTAVVAPAHTGKLASAQRNDFTPRFPIRLMSKDFGLILSAAARLGISLPTTEVAAVINSAEAARGREEDFSVVIRQMEELADVKGVIYTRK